MRKTALPAGRLARSLRVQHGAAALHVLARLLLVALLLLRGEGLPALPRHQDVGPDAARAASGASGALNALGVKYAALDILPDPRIREELSGVSGWPTIPQLFVDGELVGGSDIVMEMFESGELAELLGAEQPDLDDEPAVEPEQPVQQRPIGLENRLN